MQTFENIKIQKKLMACLWGTTVALWPFYYFILSVRIFLYFFGFLIIFGLFTLVKGFSWSQLPKKKIIPYLIFILVNILSFLVFSDYENIKASWSLNPSLPKLLIIFTFFIISTNLLSSYQNILISVKSYLLVALIFTTILILLHLFLFKSYFLTPYFSVNNYLSGYSQKNQLSFFLMLTFPYIFCWAANKKSPVLFIGVLIFFVGIIYTFSRMGVIITALSISLLCVLGINKKMYIRQTIILGVMTLIFAIAFNFGPQQFLELKFLGKVEAGYTKSKIQWITPQSSRLIYFKKSISGFKQKPFWGHGLASFGKLNPDFCKENDKICESLHGTVGLIRYPSSHNDFTQILFELGLIGLISFLYMLIYTFFKLWSHRKNIQENLSWFLDAQIVSFIGLCISLFFINAYDTLPFWANQAWSLAIISCNQRKLLNTK